MAINHKDVPYSPYLTPTIISSSRFFKDTEKLFESQKNTKFIPINLLNKQGIKNESLFWGCLEQTSIQPSILIC